MIIYHWIYSHPLIMKKRIVFLFLCFFLILAGNAWLPAYAQTPTPATISSVEVSLYPEFNRPSMLVICEITLAADTPLPIELLIQIPLNTQSLKIYSISEEDDLLEVDYEVIEFGQWQDIRLVTSTQKVKLEYYDRNLIKEGDRRIFDFHWLSIHAVNSFSLSTWLPYGATILNSDPPLDQPLISQDQTEYQLKDFGSLQPGQLFTFTMMYTKNISDLGDSISKIMPAADITTLTPGRSPSPMRVVIWLLAGAVALLLIVGLYFYWFQRNIAKQPDRVVQGVGILNPEKQVVFCHECGMRSRPEDNYCSNCGTKLRRPTRMIDSP